MHTISTAGVLGIASHHFTQGNLDVAEQHVWSVLGEDANDADALRLCGLIARQRGDLAQALDYLNRSLLCKRADAATWKDLADVHLAVGDYGQAAAHYERALVLQPDLADAHNKLGVALDLLGDAQGAANAFEAGLALQPDSPELAYNFGTFLHKEGALDRAADYFRAALRLKPQYPEASNKLATIFKEQGLLEAAIAQFQETLKIQPDHALAYYHLSEFAAEGRYRFAPEAVERIAGYARSANCSPLERSHLSFTLAAVLNKAGDYDEAFRYYKQANDLRKSLLDESNEAFNVNSFQARIDRIVADTNPERFQAVKGWGLATEMPVFIVGMPRSGSTLVEQILASHPHVFGAGEIGDIQKFSARFTVEAEPAHMLAGPAETKQLAGAYLDHLTRIGNGAARVTVKTLSNFLYLAEIVTMFPNARIIHCRRDRLDLCLSCYFQNFKDMAFAWSLDDIGTCYRAYEKLMAHWSKVLPLPIHEVRYEDLVNNQETVSRALLNFCGLNWDERCLTFFNTRRVVRTASSVQVRKPISKQAIGRWKHFRSHLGPLFEALDRPGADEPS